MKLAFLGLGLMGQGMAACLARAGHSLRVYNRNREKCGPLEALGAKAFADPAQAADGADIVFTMLADDAALSAVMTDAVITAMAPGGVHVSMSTISVALAASMTEKHTVLGRGYVACPVFGRPDAAAAGELRLCLAGAGEHKNIVAAYLPPMGECRDFGEIPSAGNAVKLAGNFMLAAMIETLGEAYAFLEKNGAEPERFYDFITTAMFAAPAVRNYGRIILDAAFDPPGFKAWLGAKDIGLVRAAAKDSKTPMPLAALMEERFLRVLAKGWGDKDWTIVTRSQREDAGLI